ncbi:hypothetical protein PIROE2DRAFT_58030 [Piromyces sp. E2]|nr:hypothetical protein PIROE2DRAFT_58030 [Piromyces sp. E2]|eukprot:OUM68469.1 hypothetical protein PIROE2DRAFT_58030 [Piromyces sp. E2]
MNNYYFFIGIILFIQTINAISMKKEDILKIDLTQFKDKNKCPEYSTGYINDIACSFRFFCLDNECQSYKNEQYLEFTNKEGKKQKYIAGICKANNKNCTTAKCMADSDCISNKCMNNVCVEGGNSIFTECNDMNKGPFQPTVTEIVCGKLQGEKCNKDEECAGKCYNDEDSYEKNIDTCHTYNVKPFNGNDCIFYLCIFCSIIIILAIIYRIYRYWSPKAEKYYPESISKLSLV